MDKNIREKTLLGFFWSLIDSFANQGIQFITGIVLARLLSPKEFGLIGLITIFITISQVFIDSGLSSALIRKMDCSEEDYSTTFYFNLIVSFVTFLLLFSTSEYISLYFEEPELQFPLKVISFGLVINAFATIQRVLLIKKIDFKTQSKISMCASVISGGIAIGMAYSNYGIWSLVFLMLIRYAITALLLWYSSSWKPMIVFNLKSFKELFSFGGNLLASQLINMIYRNGFLFIIGKYFSVIDLGYYTRADQFKSLPSNNLNSVINRVTYPILSSIEDKVNLRRAIQRLIKGTLLLSFTFMLGLAAISEPIVILLIGEKWRTCILYLQLLCIAGMFQPLHAINLNILKVEGRSDLFLKLEIIKKIVAIPSLIIGIYFGIEILILGILFNSIIALFINGYWSGKLINYGIKQQLIDIFPLLIQAILIAISTYIFGELINDAYIYKLLYQLGFLFTLFIIINEIFKNDIYLYGKKIIKSKVFK